MLKLLLIVVLTFVAKNSYTYSLNNKEISGLIVNGRDADIADFPHQLAIINRGSYICGAAVINRFFALTAAHCLDLGTPALFIHLWGGSTSRTSGGHLFFVEEYYMHPEYRRIALSTGQVVWDYDVGVIQVDQGFPLEGFPNLSPTILPEPCFTECCGVCAGTEIRMAGWVGLNTVITYSHGYNHFPLNLK